MERSLILAWILVLCTAMAPACNCQAYYSYSKPYVPPPKKVTQFHFYLHDNLSGPNTSAVNVARPSVPTAFNDTSMPFGSVFVVNYPLTLAPNITSEVIGNGQGLWASTGKDALSVVVCWDFGFTQGEFNGSSFSLFSRNPIMEPVRELAVVGGRGKFRMATGFAYVRTYVVNDFKRGNAILEYNVTVIHH